MATNITPKLFGPVSVEFDGFRDGEICAPSSGTDERLG